MIFLKVIILYRRFHHAIHASKGLGIHQKYYCSLFFCG